MEMRCPRSGAGTAPSLVSCRARRRSSCRRISPAGQAAAWPEVDDGEQYMEANAYTGMNRFLDFEGTVNPLLARISLILYKKII